MNFRKVSNPLTIVAIFAGLAEVAGTGALVALSKEIQIIFVWFVMGFPVLLVISFFFTLWNKPTSLYAPSDYDDEGNFLDAIGVTSKLAEGIDEIQKNLLEVENKIKSNENQQISKVDLEKEINTLKTQINESKGQVENVKESLNNYTTLSNKTSSLSIRIPEELKEVLVENAKKKGVSINSLLRNVLEKHQNN